MVLLGIFNVKIQYNVSPLWLNYDQTYTAGETDHLLSHTRFVAVHSKKKRKKKKNKKGHRINLNFLLVENPVQDPRFYF